MALKPPPASSEAVRNTTWECDIDSGVSDLTDRYLE